MTSGGMSTSHTAHLELDVSLTKVHERHTQFLVSVRAVEHIEHCVDSLLFRNVHTEQFHVSAAARGAGGRGGGGIPNPRGVAVAPAVVPAAAGAVAGGRMTGTGDVAGMYDTSPKRPMACRRCTGAIDCRPR